VGRFLNGCGYYETATVSFIDDATAQLFSADDIAEHLRVQDASRKSANILRQTLIGSLLGVLKTNLNAKNTPCRVFEIADTFLASNGSSDALPNERAKLALVCDGYLRDIRGVVEGLICNIDREAEVVFEPAELVWAQAGANVLVNGKTIGSAGIVSQKVKEKYDFEDVSPVAVELDFEMLLEMQGGTVKVKPIPKFPEIERDLSIVVDEQVRWADILDAVNRNTCSELEDVRYVDVYRGKGIAAGSKSVTLSLRFRDEDGTLTHDSVDNFEKAIVESLVECVQAQLRTL
jgi:phenylalanyl-tRNA synthetase beta chain